MHRQPPKSPTRGPTVTPTSSSEAPEKGRDLRISEPKKAEQPGRQTHEAGESEAIVLIRE